MFLSQTIHVVYKKRFLILYKQQVSVKDEKQFTLKVLLGVETKREQIQK